MVFTCESCIAGCIRLTLSVVSEGVNAVELALLDEHVTSGCHIRAATVHIRRVHRREMDGQHLQCGRGAHPQLSDGDDMASMI